MKRRRRIPLAISVVAVLLGAGGPRRVHSRRSTGGGGRTAAAVPVEQLDGAGMGAVLSTMAAAQVREPPPTDGSVTLYVGEEG